MKSRIVILVTAFFLLGISLCIKNLGLHKYRDYYLWHSDWNGNGLRGFYYNNTTWKGSPLFTRVEKEFYFEDIDEFKAKDIGGINFSISWQGLIKIPVSGKYKFKVTSDDGTRLFIDGVPILKNDGVQPPKKVSVKEYLRKGIYPFEIKYFQAEGIAVLLLGWRTPGLSRHMENIPPEVFIPMNEDFTPAVANRLNRDYKRWQFITGILIFVLILAVLNIKIGFIERFFCFIIKSVKENPSAFIILVIGGLFRCLFLGSVPRITGDETWHALQAFSFLEGREVNVLRGMTSYTGPFYLLQSPVYIIFGYNPWSLRTFPVLFNTLGLMSCYMLIKRIYDKRTAIFSLVLLSVYPINYMHSRLNWDITTFSVFCAFLALYLIYDQRISRLFFAGIVLGFGLYNHRLFICIPIFLLLLGLIETRGRILLNKKFYFVLIPILLIYSVKLLDTKLFGVGYQFRPIRFTESLYQIKYSIFSILPKVIDGNILYKLFTGRVLVKVLPINLAVICICLFVLCIRKRLVDKNFLRLLFGIVFTYIMIFYNVPTTAPRYYFIPVSFIGLIPSIFLGKISLKKSWLGYLSILILVAINLFYISFNYLYSYNKAVIENSFKFIEFNTKLPHPDYVVSYHYSDTERLYTYLIENGFDKVAADYFIRNNLLFWDIDNQYMDCYETGAFMGRPGECMVLYESEIPDGLDVNGLKLIEDVKGFKIYAKR